MRTALFFLCLSSLCLGAESLFDGKSLSGWDYDPAMWRVEDGVVTGGSTTQKITHNDFISTQRSYADFELRLKIKCSGDPKTGMLNSGIQIRSQRQGHAMIGYQIDCGEGWFGKIYDEHRRNKVVATPLDQAALDKAVDVFGWNEYRIRAEGPRIQVWINDVPAIDYTEKEPGIAQVGTIAPQVHSGGHCLVQFKDVTIEELPQESPLVLKIEGAELAPPGFLAKAEPTLKMWYPRIRQILGIQYDTAKEVTLRFKDMPGVAHASGTTIEAAAAYFKDHPDDVGALVHELVHVLQAYPQGSPGWLVEGIADYVRYYFYEPSRGMKFLPSVAVTYQRGYDPAAALLAKLQLGKVPNLIGQLNDLGHAGKLTEEAFTQVMGTSAEAAWKAMIAPPAANGKRDTSYNNVQGKALTAQEQLEKFHLPEGYEIELVVQESEGIGKFVSVSFDQRGRLWTQTAFEYPVDANENPAAAEALYAGKGKDKVLVYPRGALNAALPATGLGNPTVFADGLAIPLGLLPWGNGDSAYILHGHDIKLFKDTNEDGRSDESKVILTGFGVQDSHLFPHQFTRAPGGWIWMAQGLFNNSKVKRPGDTAEVDYPKCGMARMRPDGSEFEVTSVGPNNIWGLAMTASGETFIQEANDYGYPVMPFHEYAYYPGGMEAHKKSYQPDFPPTADFRMGGTGLSGLALMEGKELSKDTLLMAVANPIISKVQLISMKRDAQATSGWALAQAPDLITCDDPFFRPVALTQGPEGHLYIVDWYNKIISHNEVPRNHPDRDKTRGRIWRVKATGSAPIPDFTTLKDDELKSLLGQAPTARSHLAWQTLSDRGHSQTDEPHEAPSTRSAIAAAAQKKDIGALLSFAKPLLTEPTAPASRGSKLIPVGAAYHRTFERFLVRMFLERQPKEVAAFLSTEPALPPEALMLAALSMEPEASAAAVAKYLPKLDRDPNEEELLRLAQYPEEPGCGEALTKLLQKPETASLLLSHKTKLDPVELAPFLTRAARNTLSTEPSLALSLISSFQLTALEPDVVSLLASKPAPALLLALKELRSAEVAAMLPHTKSKDAALQNAALGALAASRSPEAPALLLGLLPDLSPTQSKSALTALSSTAPGSRAILAALTAKALKPDELDAPAIEHMVTVLTDAADIATLQSLVGGVFGEVLLLDGQNTAVVNTSLTLDGPFTVEAWVKLAPGIHNEDSLLGAPGQLDLNFFQGRFRFYAGPQLHDVCVSQKPLTVDLWTHVAVTRSATGEVRIYQNGELDAVGTKPCTLNFRDCDLGWSGPAKGTHGAMAEFRLWKTARSAAEIRSSFDRKSLKDAQYPSYAKLGKGARLTKSLDLPPLLTEDQAKAMDAKFAKYHALASQPGDAQQGKLLSALCMSCHQIGSAGGQIGPNLSGVGAMGKEAILRNILTPNAAMEPGYRIFRLETTTGEVVDAFYVSEDATAYVIRQPGAADKRVPKASVKSTRYLRRSLMPEGLLDALSDSQVRDLFSYLSQLRG